MEILTMISSAQIPQTPGGSGAADEAGGAQGRSGESSFFGLLFGLKGAADGKEASQAFSQLMASPAPDGTLAMAFPPAGKAFGRLPGQTAAADAPAAESGTKMAWEEAPGLMVAEGPTQPWGEGAPMLLTLPENAALAQLPADGPVMPVKGKSADSSPPAEADETGGKKEEKAVVPFPLFTAVIPLIVGNPARPEQSVEAASTQTAKAQSADAADVSTVVAGNPVQQPADAEAGAIPPQGAAVDLLAKADVPPDAGAVSRMALAKGAAVNGGEPAEKAPVAVNQGSDGKAPAAGDAKAAFSREGLDIVVPGAKGKGAAENGHGAATDTGVTESGAEKAVQLQAPLPAGSRRLGEAAGNAYKDALERAGQGSGRNTPATDNSVQGKAPVNAAAASASTGVDTERVEVVLAAKQGGARAEQGESPARKSQEVKGSDSPVTIGVTLDAAQPRGAGESRSVGQASGERIPTGGEIVSQVREKLEATGRIADDGQITLKLHPQELGELKINMRLDDHNLKVEIVTQNPSVKEALMQNLDTLKETLSRQNISMERFDVSADLRQGFTQGGREERQMAQDNRGVGSGYQYAAEAEEELASTPKYPWESENSLVNLML